MHPSIETNSSHNGSRLYRRIVLAGVFFGLVFGTVGYLIYGTEYGKENTSFLTAFYHAIQLFALHMPHLEGRINMPLEIGRWAAAISSGLAIVLLLRRGFLAEWRLIRLPESENHVVICGLGEVGTRLALEFSNSRYGCKRMQ